MKRHWMPLYIADYLADTAHLTTMEHGAYILLIMHYWLKGSLPDDEKVLARIARMNTRQWSQSRDILRSLFGDGWRHKRIDEELAQVIEKSRVNSANAKVRYKGRTPVAEEPQVRSDTHLQSQSHLEEDRGALRAPPPTPELKPEKKKRPPKTKTTTPAATPVDPAWPLPTENLEYARSIGLTEVEAAREWKKFKIHHHAKGSKWSSWYAAWQKWARNFLEFNGRAPKDEVAAPPADATKEFTPDQWKQVLRVYATTNNWPLKSPPPGEPGCLVPRELIPEKTLF